MTKIVIVLVCWACTLQVLAQDKQSKQTSTDSSEFHTIFHKSNGTHKIPMGYFIEMNGGYSHFGHESVFLPGISLGVILNHHWTLGVTGSLIGSPQRSFHHLSETDSTEVNKHGSSSKVGGYGGLLFEYTLFPQSRVHVSFPLIIGGGYLVQSQSTHYADSTYSTNDWGHHSFSHGDSFFVIEPGVKLELNIIKNLRVGLGVSYHYSPNMDHRNTSPEVIDQFTVKLGIRLGKF